MSRRVGDVKIPHMIALDCLNNNLAWQKYSLENSGASSAIFWFNRVATVTGPSQSSEKKDRHQGSAKLHTDAALTSERSAVTRLYGGRVHGVFISFL